MWLRRQIEGGTALHEMEDLYAPRELIWEEVAPEYKGMTKEKSWALARMNWSM